MKRIAVEDMQPDKRMECLMFAVYEGNGNRIYPEIFIGRWLGKKAKFYCEIDPEHRGEVTHWIPLPAPPDRQYRGKKRRGRA